MRARLVSLSNCAKITPWRSLVSATSLTASSASLSDKVRTRSTTRPRRDEVDRIMLPQAEIKTAGVIIAVSTVTAEDVGSTSIFSSTSPSCSPSFHDRFNWRRCRGHSYHWLWFHLLLNEVDDHLLRKVGPEQN